VGAAAFYKWCGKKYGDSNLYVKLLRLGRLFFRGNLLSRADLPKPAAALGFAARRLAVG
jgi:hypothetical protein